MGGPADHRLVEELTREAFWGYMNPTSDEHYLVHLLRQSPAAAEAISSRGLKNLKDFHRYSGREIPGWEGIDRNAFTVINEVLGEWGIPRKLHPILPTFPG